MAAAGLQLLTSMMQGRQAEVERQRQIEQEQRAQAIQELMARVRMRNAELAGEETRQRMDRNRRQDRIARQERGRAADERLRERSERESAIDAIQEREGVSRKEALAIYLGNLPTSEEQESTDLSQAATRENIAASRESRTASREEREERQELEDQLEQAQADQGLKGSIDSVLMNPNASIDQMLPVLRDKTGYPERVINSIVEERRELLERQQDDQGLTAAERRTIDSQAPLKATEIVSAHGGDATRAFIAMTDRWANEPLEDGRFEEASREAILRELLDQTSPRNIAAMREQMENPEGN